MQSGKKESFEKALKAAQVYEEITGQKAYVTYSFLTKGYIIVGQHPLLGEWYTSDGIQHGDGPIHL